MNKFHCEMFGHFIYDESLTYEELLDMEMRLIGDVQLVLERSNAEHLDFTPLGDELMVQCAFDDYAPEVFQEICRTLSPFLHPSVEARLLFVDKHLGSLRVFHMNCRTWQEHAIELPFAHEALAEKKPKAAQEKGKRVP